MAYAIRDLILGRSHLAALAGLFIGMIVVSASITVISTLAPTPVRYSTTQLAVNGSRDGFQTFTEWYRLDITSPDTVPIFHDTLVTVALQITNSIADLDHGTLGVDLVAESQTIEFTPPDPIRLPLADGIETTIILHPEQVGLRRFSLTSVISHRDSSIDAKRPFHDERRLLWVRPETQILPVEVVERRLLGVNERFWNSLQKLGALIGFPGLLAVIVAHFLAKRRGTDDDPSDDDERPDIVVVSR